MLGCAVQKLVYANQGLKVNQSVQFSCIKMSFTTHVLSILSLVKFKTEGQTHRRTGAFGLGGKGGDLIARKKNYTIHESMCCTNALKIIVKTKTFTILTVLLRDLNFKLSDRAPPDKIALSEGGTVLFETRSIGTPLASAILLKFKSRSKTIGYTVHGGAKRSSIC